MALVTYVTMNMGFLIGGADRYDRKILTSKFTIAVLKLASSCIAGLLRSLRSMHLGCSV